ncbi:hypothetical protein N9M69_04360 [Flavobacteriaceae bacterium]|nr:hypothetical protein [Flavobacteriaceae bacterium]
MHTKKKSWLFTTLVLLGISTELYGQKLVKSDTLFSNQTPLKVQLSYSNKDLNLKTNDSTFIQSSLVFFEKNEFKEIPVSLRARGNFRRKNCFFTPIKMKVKKSAAAETIFSGNTSLKMVLPCKNEKDNNDNIIKEFIAYKIYEIVSPYYFKTRRLEVDLNDKTHKEEKKYNLNGFLIEDDDKLAKRFGGKIVKRKIPSMAMDHFNSVNLSFFNYLIGNTDFSSSQQHNGKLLYYEKKIIPIPYDFDLTGWVNPSYGKGVINRLGYQTEKRKYIGFNRDRALFEEVRNHFKASKEDIFTLVNSFQTDFDYRYEFDAMLDYLKDFYRILESDKLFKRLIVSQAR